LCLVYAPKRISYSHQGMVTRTILAAMDHNNNLERNIVGDKVYYSKATKEYKLSNKFEPKNSQWRLDEVNRCVEFVTNPDLIQFNPEIDEVLCPFDLPKSIVPFTPPDVEELRKKRDKWRE